MSTTGEFLNFFLPKGSIFQRENHDLGGTGGLGDYTDETNTRNGLFIPFLSNVEGIR